jgi:hypothetical protein
MLIFWLEIESKIKVLIIITIQLVFTFQHINHVTSLQFVFFLTILINFWLLNIIVDT